MPEYKESEQTRAERIAKAKEEYNASLKEVTANNTLYIAALTNMCNLPYSPSECCYLAHHTPNASELDTFSNWNKRGYRINKGEKGLTLLEKDKGNTVYFDISQTNAPPSEKPIKAQRLPKEKLSALWSCDVRILTATKKEYTNGMPVYFNKELNAIIIDRKLNIPNEKLYPALAKEVAHAYLYRSNIDAYDHDRLDSTADAVKYTVCRKNNMDCTLPPSPKDLTPKEVKAHLETIQTVTDKIQSNIDYYYQNGKPQFEKPKTTVKSEKENEQSKESKPEQELTTEKETATKSPRKSIKDILREKKEQFLKKKNEKQSLAKNTQKEIGKNVK